MEVYDPEWACIRRDLNMIQCGDKVEYNSKKGIVLQIYENRTCDVVFGNNLMTNLEEGTMVLMGNCTSDNVYEMQKKVGRIMSVEGDACNIVLENGATVSWQISQCSIVTYQVLLRDCKIVVPSGRKCQTTRTVSSINVISTRETMKIDSNGRVTSSRNERRDVGNISHKHAVTVIRSAPLEKDVMCNSITFSVDGMDQGWGNTGEAGVSLYHTAETACDHVWDKENPLYSFIFDRRRSRSEKHTQTIVFHQTLSFSGSFVVVLFCPPYAGWSSWVRNIEVSIGTFTNSYSISGEPLPNHWDDYAASAYSKIHQLLTTPDSESKIHIDKTHLSLEGQEMQHCWYYPASDNDDRGPLTNRVDEPNKLFMKLDNNSAASGAPNDPVSRRKKYNTLRNRIHMTLDIIKKNHTQKDFMEIMDNLFDEAAGHCMNRWEREIFNLYDMVTGEMTGLDALPAEDLVLQDLCNWRRHLAEEDLHNLKGQIANSDLHFENYYYGHINFGVPEELEARNDSSRHTYDLLQTADIGVNQRALWTLYTVPAIRERICASILRSTSKGSQIKREKLLDYLRDNIPEGFRQGDPNRVDTWLYEVCHDENYEMTTFAIHFALCKMHILELNLNTREPVQVVQQDASAQQSPQAPVNFTDAMNAFLRFFQDG